MASLVVALLLVGLFALSHEAQPNYRPRPVDRQAHMCPQPKYKVIF